MTRYPMQRMLRLFAKKVHGGFNTEVFLTTYILSQAPNLHWNRHWHQHSPWSLEKILKIIDHQCIDEFDEVLYGKNEVHTSWKI